MQTARQRIEAILAASPKTPEQQAADEACRTARETALSWGHGLPDDPRRAAICEASWAAYDQVRGR